MRKWLISLAATAALGCTGEPSQAIYSSKPDTTQHIISQDGSRRDVQLSDAPNILSIRGSSRVEKDKKYIYTVDGMTNMSMVLGGLDSLLDIDSEGIEKFRVYGDIEEPSDDSYIGGFNSIQEVNDFRKNVLGPLQSFFTGIGEESARQLLKSIGPAWTNSDTMEKIFLYTSAAPQTAALARLSNQNRYKIPISFTDSAELYAYEFSLKGNIDGSRLVKETELSVNVDYEYKEERPKTIVAKDDNVIKTDSVGKWVIVDDVNKNLFGGYDYDFSNISESLLAYLEAFKNGEENLLKRFDRIDEKMLRVFNYKQCMIPESRGNILISGVFSINEDDRTVRFLSKEEHFEEFFHFVSDLYRIASDGKVQLPKYEIVKRLGEKMPDYCKDLDTLLKKYNRKTGLVPDEETARVIQKHFSQEDLVYLSIFDSIGIVMSTFRADIRHNEQAILENNRPKIKRMIEEYYEASKVANSIIDGLDIQSSKHADPIKFFDFVETIDKKPQFPVLHITQLRSTNRKDPFILVSRYKINSIHRTYDEFSKSVPDEIKKRFEESKNTALTIVNKSIINENFHYKLESVLNTDLHFDFRGDISQSYLEELKEKRKQENLPIFVLKNDKLGRFMYIPLNELQIHDSAWPNFWN